jgi:glycyl-tRNA synthetase beta chain
VADFLLELRSEEIPARMQDKARDDLARLFAAELAKSGLHTDAIVTFATPRRLALIARDLPLATAAVSEETKGPKTSAPPQALEGFLRKTGLTREQLVERDGVFFAVVERAGRATADVLAEAIPAVIRAFPWPKSMRWGAASLSTESIRWVRPLQGIVALFGEDVVPCEIAGVVSGAQTVGHRFHHPGVITIGSAGDYVEKLHACHVIVDQDERRQIIALGATMAVRDEGLLTENAGLTEWPVPLLGRFDEAFLAVPPEVIQLTARVNQKYFVCRDMSGNLANAFVCTANIDAVDGGEKIVEGNQKVLAARLSDAKFFYETDLKVPLADQAKKLDRIVFHEKLGTVADKVARVAKLAEWLASEGIVPGCDPALARRAAELCKADLVTGMVGEFPELQGLMGGYYAAAQGEPTAVAEAIRDHYKPVGQGDDVPTAPVTVAVSLADKLDSIAAFFAVDEQPTGSRDPFALRRAALGALALIVRNGLRLGLEDPVMFSSSIATLAYRWETTDLAWKQAAPNLLHKSIGNFLSDTSLGNQYFNALRIWSEGNGESFHSAALVAAESSIHFLADRLKVQQREAGVRHDLIDAVFALGGEDDLVRLLARVHALQAFVGTEDGANLLAGYKRAANILKKEGFSGSEAAPEYTLEPAEAALVAALDVAEPAAADAVAREDFEAAMAALAMLRAPIDTFFESVIVNDPDPAKRTARLALLARVRGAVHGVADFSRIEG